MTKVLHVFGAMDVGGAELRTLELVQALTGLDVEFHFLTLSGRPGALDAELEALGAMVHPLRLDWAFPVRYGRLLRRLRPDAIDSHVATFSGALLLGAKLMGVPRRIAHFRSDGDGHGNTVRRRLQRSLMKALIRGFATDIVGVSPSALSHGYNPGWRVDPRARVLVNGIPSFITDANRVSLRALMKVSPDTPVLAHIGRPSPEKNRVHTIQVLAAVRQRGLPAHLALIGGVGADTERVRQQAAELRVAAFVHDLGVRRDARELMSQADTVLLTSLREGLPGVVIESVSTGTPVVASALPGVVFIARELPGVRTVDLNEPLDLWAVAVVQAVKEGSDSSRRTVLKRAFDHSIFSAKSSALNHLDLYGAPMRTTPNVD
jgi:glycosyltransferase involved in cell wall biosynthesis